MIIINYLGLIIKIKKNVRINPLKTRVIFD